MLRTPSRECAAAVVADHKQSSTPRTTQQDELLNAEWLKGETLGVWHSPERFFAEAEPTHVPQLDASVFALRDGGGLYVAYRW